MTHFIDGPAQGKLLNLRRKAKFLRVTESNGEWDALDMLEDTARPGEKIYAYQIAEDRGMVHIRASKPAASGFFAMASYKFCAVQPPDIILRNNGAWSDWCMANKGLLDPQFLKPPVQPEFGGDAA